MKNPYLTYTDEELCNVIKDIWMSEENGKRVESFVPYAREIKENIGDITLREALEIARKDFYDVLCKRFYFMIERE